MNKILPSLMSQSQKELDQDFKNLKNTVKTLHLDIVDGKFAPRRTFQFPFRLQKNFQYHAHLMVRRPEPFIREHLKQIHLFLPHFEEIKDKEKYIRFMQQHRKPVGFALLPETEVKVVKPYLSHLSYLLILTVRPGFYGGQFINSKAKKIWQAKKLSPKIKIIVDGGINPVTIKKAKAADFFVSGSYTTKSGDPKERIKTLIKALK